MPFTKETKLQLLQDIAREFSIEWDSKALEQKLFTPPPPTTQVSLHEHHFLCLLNQNQVSPFVDQNSLFINNAVLLEALHQSCFLMFLFATCSTLLQKQPEYASVNDNVGEKYKSNKREEDAYSRRNTHERGNKMSNLKDCNASSEGSELNLKPHRGRVQSSSEDETVTDFSQDESKTSSSSASVSEDDADSKKPFYYRLVPPPYLKPKPQSSLDHEPKKLNSHVGQEEASTTLHENPVVEDKPKPRSVRQRNLKPPPGYDSSSKQEPRPGLRTMKGDDKDPKDDEEKMIDGLLMHLSNKRSPYESNRSKKPELATPPGRVSSLPTEPSSPAEASKGPARATSFQPEMLSKSGHVHPKLPPDFDEFTARIAALRGK